MDKIKVLIVDDEYLALQLLENFIDKVPELELVAKTKSPNEALDILKKQSIDLLFLDIQMPTRSGVDLLKSLTNPPATIFTTAYSQYAVTAYNLNVVDYLLKPFSLERFTQAIDKAKVQLSKGATSEQLSSIGNSKEPIFLSIKADSKIVKVYIKDILYIKGLKEYVQIICKEEKLVTFERLKNIQALLPDDLFMRIHKSYIINTSKVKSIKGNQLTIGDHVLPISRGKKEIVKRRVF